MDTSTIVWWPSNTQRGMANTAFCANAHTMPRNCTATANAHAGRDIPGTSRPSICVAQKVVYACVEPANVETKLSGPGSSWFHWHTLGELA